MTLTVVDWCQNIALVLLLAWVVLLSHRSGQRKEREAALETWAGFRDPDYWKERQGPDAGPYLNEEPEPDGPPDCEKAGGFHVADDRGGKTCKNCPAVFA